MSKGRRLIYILGGFLLLLALGYFIFTGTQVGPVELETVGEAV